MSEQPGPQPGPDKRARGRKAVNWRRDPVILRRMADVERRHLAGEVIPTIAAALDVDERTVKRDLARLRQFWQERLGEQLEVLRADAVRELEALKREALAAAAWDQLCEQAVLFGLAVEIATPDGPRIARVQRDDKGSATFRGNKAAALNVARQAVVDKAKILGLVVDKIAPTDAAGQTLDLAGLLERARQIRAQREQEAHGQPATD